MDKVLEQDILARGKEFFKSISGESPSIFNKSWWTGKVMDFAMREENFKVQLFRFVDVMPYLNESDNLVRHIKEYFGGDADVPTVLKWGASMSGIGGSFTGKILGKTIRANIEAMGRQFIIGENAKEALRGMNRLRKDKFTFTVDLLGEASVSEDESEAYAQGYHEILDALAKEQLDWAPHPAPGSAPGGKTDSKLDWGSQPMVNASIKPSALYSQARPVDVEGSVEAILARLKPIYRKLVNMGGALCVDIEQLKYREITIELFKRLRSDPEFAHYPHLTIVQQCYLRDCADVVRDLIAWGRKNKLPFGIRLVKGAYWDAETVTAKQKGWPIPLWIHKPESDIAFEKIAALILDNSDLVYFCCASHNVRSISAVVELAKARRVPEARYEFQVLYGMGEPVRKGLLKVAGRVRLYAPYGELVPGMAYLVRRLLENTANDSFLRQGFADGVAVERLLENPEITLERELAGRPVREAGATGLAGLAPFANEPMIDFTVREQREAFPKAIAKVRKTCGRELPLYIDGKKIKTEDRIPSNNPAQPDEVIATVCQAGTAEVDAAVAAAKKAFRAWQKTPVAERAACLTRAAAIARRRIYELSAVQVLEVGKQWDQAFHDVGEGIDFLEYYAREMLRLGAPRRLGRAPGEVNMLSYQGKGVAAVISPWNFPFAIAVGMASAAMVTGNTVVFKPASIASAIGYGLVEIFREAGLPDGVFNFCPGRSAVMGDHLVEHPDVSLVCFTGSMEVGLRIVERAAATRPQAGQGQVRRVIAEMGGKNAIIIDDDADLDEAVLQVLASAFGFQGQKCSACSRVVVLDSIYERFVRRLVKGARALKVGPAEDPSNFMGPLADASLAQNVMKYVELAEKEGKVLLRRDDYPIEGAYVPLTIVEGITPKHRLAQEEVFGPVLAVMRAPDFDEAIAIANSTRFALTGAVFSRSPEHLAQAGRDFNVGNLYLNQGSTGAMVGRQAFGGYKMSGVGSKTGGPDYLLQFMDPRCVTENTIRRGFTPIADDDDWID